MPETALNRAAREALTNLAGNAAATIVVALWEEELDAGKAREVLRVERG